VAPSGSPQIDLGRPTVGSAECSFPLLASPKPYGRPPARLLSDRGSEGRRHTFATWAIENEARELDVQHLLGHSTPAMVRRYSATYDAEKAARAHERFSPADRMGERLG